MTADLDVVLLGQAQVSLGRRPLTGFISRKAQALVCYLAATGRAQTRDELATLLWGDMPDARAKANLRVVLSNLRQLLGQLLVVDRRKVALHPDLLASVDVLRFQALTRGLQSGAPTHDISQLRAATDLYAGDLLEGFLLPDAPVFDEWLLLQREHLRQTVLQAYYVLAEHYTVHAEYATALQYATRVLAIEPWQEEVQRQVMLLLALSGQRAAALAQYKTCCQVLHHELGVEPDPETTALYERIRTGSIGADPGSSAVPGASRAEYMPPQPLIGRGPAVAWLLAQWETACTGAAGLTLINGVSGVGKTSLLAAALEVPRGRGALQLRTSCEAYGVPIPYQPIADLLRAAWQATPATFAELPDYWLLELTRLLPEVRILRPELAILQPSEDTTQRQRLFAAVAAAFAAVARAAPFVLCVFDDLHYADAETLDLLFFLVRRGADVPVCYVGAYCSEAVVAGHPLNRLRSNLVAHRQVATLTLDPLSMQEVGQLVALQGWCNSADATRMALYLYDQTDGVPFLLHQVLHDLQQRGVIRSTADGWILDRTWDAQIAPPPPLVRERLLAGIARLPAEERGLLQLAAVLGPVVELSRLTAVVGAPRHEVAAAIGQLQAAGLLREMPVARSQSTGRRSDPTEICYKFAHELLWQAVLSGMTAIQRQCLLDQVTLHIPDRAGGTRNWPANESPRVLFS